MGPIRISLTTLGCKLNFVDTEEMQQMLMDENFTIVPFGEKADVTIINTCTVTGKADFKSRRLISKAHRLDSKTKIIVTGCYAELDPDILDKLSGVSLVLSLEEQSRITEHVRNLLDIDENTCSLKQTGSTSSPRHMTNLSRAFIKVQRGCNNRCTFCRVWQARGPSRSEPLSSILEQMHIFLNLGYEELVITGVDMGSWGKDLESSNRFSDLLARLVEESGTYRIRLSSIYPMDIDEQGFDLLTSHPRICRHLHLPLQSGSPAILKRMGRHMAPEEFLDLSLRLRDSAGRFGIGADVIVGFPGETDDDFSKTVDLVEKSALTYLHVFPYSARRGTAAARLPDQVPPSAIKDRSRILRSIGLRKRQEFRTSFPGGPAEILVEKRRLPETNLLTGFTSDYLRVDIPGPDEWMGKLKTIEFQPGLEGIDD